MVLAHVMMIPCVMVFAHVMMLPHVMVLAHVMMLPRVMVLAYIMMMPHVMVLAMANTNVKQARRAKSRPGTGGSGVGWSGGRGVGSYYTL